MTSPVDFGLPRSTPGLRSSASHTGLILAMEDSRPELKVDEGMMALPPPTLSENTPAIPVFLGKPSLFCHPDVYLIFQKQFVFCLHVLFGNNK